jgi:hypothetical protein
MDRSFPAEDHVAALQRFMSFAGSAMHISPAKGPLPAALRRCNNPAHEKRADDCKLVVGSLKGGRSQLLSRANTEAAPETSRRLFLYVPFGIGAEREKRTT